MNFDTAIELTLPGQDDFADATGKQYVSDTVYNDMVALTKVINEYDHSIAFEYVLHRAHEDYGYSIEPDEFSKHKGRLDRLAVYDRSVYWHVVGRIPRSDIWVEMALEYIGEDEVTGDNLNEVQKACVEIGSQRGEAYFDATKRELQERALNDVEAPDYASTGNLVDDVINNVTSIAAKVLPQRQESKRQGGQSSAGNANEEIAAQSLKSHGLEEGERGSGCDLTEKTSDDSDLIVYDDRDAERYVEVKSTAARERVGRAVDDDEDEYWALLGFFTSTAEVRNGVLFSNNQTPAWSETTDVAYVPPGVVKEVRELDDERNDGPSASTLRNDDGQLYLRANNLFPEDMASLNENGRLTDVSPTHEEQFL